MKVSYTYQLEFTATINWGNGMAEQMNNKKSNGGKDFFFFFFFSVRWSNPKHKSSVLS